MNKKRPPLFDRLHKALEDGLSYARGEKVLKTTKVSIPDPPAVLTPEQIQALRRRLSLSQAGFARLLVVSPKTIQSWEQGQRSPAGTASRLLQLLDHPELVKSFVGKETA